MDRTHLPYAPPREPAGPDALAEDLRDQRAPLPAAARAHPPAGAPNVLVILIDDMGFGASSAFGGPCRMPTADRLAAGGLRYSRFHTTAMCSPTRQALMTGRNHHAVGMGTVLEIVNGLPGYDGRRPDSAATLAQVLQGNGYATGAFGKWHQTPPWEQTAAGPYDRWPTREGFDHFYGFLGGEASQFEPTLVCDTTFVDPPATAEQGYHLSEDLVDRARDWVRRVRTHDPDKPWFCYLSFGATHAPFQVPEGWRDRYRGEFAHGYDAQREATLARQKELGVVPEDAELAPWTPYTPHWDELEEPAREAAERLMETYAAFAEHTDVQVGRLVDALSELGELDDTVVLYVLGDNGASGEGGVHGTLNEGLHFNGLTDDPERILAAADTIGGPESYVHYPVGWAVAMDTPYQWTKQVASHYGGTRNGLIVHWPAGIAARGEVRHQWHHVVDVFPTILQLAGVPAPETVNGVVQEPRDGVSMAYSLDGPDEPERHHTQYFEMFGNRGIYHRGWTAVTPHKVPWQLGQELGPLAEDVWELYDTRTDWTQARDVAAEHPEKLAELQELFLDQARRNRVLPMDDRSGGRGDAAALGGVRPEPPTALTLWPGDGRLREDRVPSVRNCSWRVATTVAPADPAEANGVIVAQGSRFGGWSLWLDDGVLRFSYAYLGLEAYEIAAGSAIGVGERALEVVFTRDAAGAAESARLGAGGEVVLRVDGEVLGRGRLERTVPVTFSMDQTLDVGADRGTPVTAYPVGEEVGVSAVTARGFPIRCPLGPVRIETGLDGAEPVRVPEEAARHAALVQQ